MTAVLAVVTGLALAVAAVFICLWVVADRDAARAHDAAAALRTERDELAAELEEHRREAADALWARPRSALADLAASDVPLPPVLIADLESADYPEDTR